MKRIANRSIRWLSNDVRHSSSRPQRQSEELHPTRRRPPPRTDIKRTPGQRLSSSYYNSVVDSSWKDNADGNYSRHSLSWKERIVPQTNNWKKPHVPQGIRGAKLQSEAMGVWSGRPEDELKIPSGWKGGGGAWTWRVFDNECEADYNGLDISRVRQTKPWCTALSGALLTKGKHEWQIRLTGNTRAARVGVALPTVSLFDNLAWGPETPSAWVLTDLGSLWHNEKLVSRCSPYRRSQDIVTLTCDMDEGTLSFKVNNRDLGDKSSCFEFIPSSPGVVPVVCFRERPVTAELRHVFSTDPPVDVGPNYKNKPIVRGQIANIPKRDPNGILPAA